MGLREMLEEWNETKDLSLANDICEELWEEMENFDDELKLD
jgi:hypothetical protein